MFTAGGWVVLHCGAGRVVTRWDDREIHNAAGGAGWNHAVGVRYASGDLSGSLIMGFHPARSLAMDLCCFFCCGGNSWACEVVCFGVSGLGARAVREWERKQSEEGTSKAGESSGWRWGLAGGLLWG